MGPSLGFVTNVFFRVDLCYILWSVLLHHRISSAPLLEINCTIGVVFRQCFSILFEFQVIRKGCIFHLFCHLSFYFFAPAAFILELHRCSNLAKGRSISRVQTENCYYFRNGFCFSLWVNCRVDYCHCHLKCVLRSIPGGGGVLPYLSYTGTCRPSGYGFLTVRS